MSWPPSRSCWLCLFVICAVRGLEKKLLGQAGLGLLGVRGFCALPLGLTPCLPLPVIMVAHFLQSLTHRLVLGGELVYHRRPGEEGAILTLAGKYSGMG